MKKKLNIVEIAIAIIFIAATASAGVSYSPLVPKTFECLIFELDFHQLHAVEAVDEKGSKYIHVDIVPRKLTEVFYYRHTSGGRFLQSWHAKANNSGTSLQGSGESRQAVMIMNAREGSTDGYIVFIMDIPRVDAFTPSTQLHLSGTFNGEWNEEEQRYILKSGSGVIAGHSTATKWAAWDYMEQAVPSIQSSMSPAWGSFTVRRAILTEKEIVQLIK